MRAEEDPPVCQTLMDRESRFAHREHRQFASAGSGQKSTSRCPLCPQRWHSMNTVWDPRAMPRSVLCDTRSPASGTLWHCISRKPHAL